ncbi:MAG: Na+-transporting methylmalonyl-CoA/oxaloacetate decarboxylase subunit beta [Negativicutes bacterium]|nr:Na+-transporting methylmalonyl-CoA/oxaloacetate decarboxylase subunit beta [Negativicutes bacterium]
MKVYYDASLWRKKKGTRGLPQKINWQFEHAGHTHWIPVIYRFPRGIVFDLITFLDEAKLAEFVAKYENIDDKLTPLLRRCAEQEHPYQPLHWQEIWLNGQKAEQNDTSSSRLCVPWQQEDDLLLPQRKAYASILRQHRCFACTRVCLPYPKTKSLWQKLARGLRLNRIQELRLVTLPEQWFSLLELKFDITAAPESRTVCFTHPTTGVRHTLYYREPQEIEIPFGNQGMRNFYAFQGSYEIEPALPAADSLQFGSDSQLMKSIQQAGNPEGAAAIGIIGGAADPGCLLLTAERQRSRGPHGLPLYACLSAPSLKKDPVAHFVLEGINTIKTPSQTYRLQ